MDSLYRNKYAFLLTRVIITDIPMLMCILVVSAMDLSIIFFAGVFPDSASQSLSCFRSEVMCSMS